MRGGWGHAAVAVLWGAALACSGEAPNDAATTDEASPTADTADPVREPVAPAIPVLAASVDLPDDGCLSEAVTVGGDITLTLDAGTCLTDASGRVLSGEVTVTLGPDPLRLDGFTTPQFAVELTVSLEPQGAFVDARFDPPVTLATELDPVPTSGAWVRYRLDEGDAEEDGAVEVRWDGPERIPLSHTGVHGAVYEVQQAGGTRALACDNPVTHQFVIGRASDVWPKVMSMLIINPRTSQIMRALRKWDGIGNGEHTSSTYVPTMERDFEASVRHIGGDKVFELTTCYKNAFIVRYSLAHDPDRIIESITIEQEEVRPADEEPESCPDGTYIGAIEVDVRGCNPRGFRQLREVRQAFDLWSSANYDPNARPPGLVLDLFTILSDEEWYARLRIHHWSQSVRAFPLSEMFPEGTTATYDDRRIIVRMPCPPPVAAVAAGGGFQWLDPATFAPQGDPAALPFPPQGIEPVTPDQMVPWAPGQLGIVDQAGPSVQSVPVPGLLGPPAIDPIDDQVWVDDGKDWFPIDLETTLPSQGLPLPALAIRARTMRPDGGVIWVVGGVDGAPGVARLDVLRQDVQQEVTLPKGGALDCVAVTPDGQGLWAASLAPPELLQLDPFTLEPLGAQPIPELVGCPVIGATGTWAALPLDLGKGQGAIGLFDLALGSMEPVPVNGVPAQISAAPASQARAFGFVVPSTQQMGWLEPGPKAWVVQHVPMAQPMAIVLD